MSILIFSLFANFVNQSLLCDGGYLWGLPNSFFQLHDGGYLIKNYYYYKMGAAYEGYLITPYYYVMGLPMGAT